MLVKLLIAAQVAAWLWILSICASLFGWPALLAVGAVAVPAGLMAGAWPERCGWLIGRRPPPPPKPVDPAAMDGGPVF